MSDDKKDKSADVLVFRTAGNEPIAVPADVVTQVERAYRCHQDRIAGKSWAEIAEREKYPSAAAASADVSRYMAEAAALVLERTAKVMLALEVERLDALQTAVWAQAMVGHIPSVNAALSIIVQRSKLLKLDQPEVSAEHVRTVVVPAEAAGYMRALQEAAGDTAKPS